jgi:hypothetical protein
MILPLGFLAAAADQLLGEQDIGWGDVGEICLYVADRGVEGAQDDVLPSSSSALKTRTRRCSASLSPDREPDKG